MKRGDAEGARRRARRQRIAVEAARLMATQGLQDSREAARRAARALGEADAREMPEHGEVIAQLRDYQRLFQRDTQPAALRARRAAAAEAMAYLAAFEPLLYGSVLDGSADERSPVLLQVFSDDPDAFARFMHEQAWMQRVQTANRRVQLRRDGHQDFASWRFAADGIDFDVVALPRLLQRQAPLGPDGRPMARAGLAAVRKLGSESTFPGEDDPIQGQAEGKVDSDPSF
jgi:hypothetical protein